MSFIDTSSQKNYVFEPNDAGIIRRSMNPLSDWLGAITSPWILLGAVGIVGFMLWSLAKTSRGGFRANPRKRKRRRKSNPTYKVPGGKVTLKRKIYVIPAVGKKKIPPWAKKRMRDNRRLKRRRRSR